MIKRLFLVLLFAGMGLLYGDVNDGGMSRGDLSVSLFPNPANGNFDLSISQKESGDIKVTVYNLLGSRVMSLSLNEFSGDRTLQINLPEGAKGMFLVEVSSLTQTITKRVVVTP